MDAQKRDAPGRSADFYIQSGDRQSAGLPSSRTTGPKASFGEKHLGINSPVWYYLTSGHGQQVRPLSTGLPIWDGWARTPAFLGSLAGNSVASWERLRSDNAGALWTPFKIGEAAMQRCYLKSIILFTPANNTYRGRLRRAFSGDNRGSTAQHLAELPRHINIQSTRADVHH